jgi:hypothetical protein
MKKFSFDDKILEKNVIDGRDSVLNLDAMIKTLKGEFV